MTSPITHLLYLHGFRSSPLSMKARKTADWMQQHRPDVEWWCPPLPPSPQLAMQQVIDRLSTWPSDGTAVIGSSLGGFYATVVAERLGCPAVLLNPAVDPARDLVKHIGEMTAWHSEERLYFDAAYIDELRSMQPPKALTRRERYFAIIAKGDEVLSWQEMAGRYAGCRLTVLEGGDHALSDYDEHLPNVMRFLGLAR